MITNTLSDTSTPGKKSPLRWVIAVALLLAAVLNYIDRSVLGLLAPTIQKELVLSDNAYAMVINFFLTGYTIAYLLSGRLVDKIGVRLSMALFIAWWSISNALTGLARSVWSLSTFRFMLGLGEAGGFTASPKAVSEWFPASERGIAIGLYSVGGALGATIAPGLVAVISGHLGWRWVFAISPILGGLWLVFWFSIYKTPVAHETEHLSEPETSAPAVTAAPVSEISVWRKVFSEPRVWLLLVARLLTDPVWYFYQFWMPKYLSTVRGLDQNGLGRMWTIFLAADIGFLLGGLLSGLLIKRGLFAPASRLRIMLVSAFLVPLSALIPGMATVGGVFAVSTAIAYGLTSWLGNLSAMIVDLLPQRILGTAFGVIACGSALGGMVMNSLNGWLFQHHHYNTPFYLMAFLHPLTLILVWRLGRKPAGTGPAGPTPVLT